MVIETERIGGTTILTISEAEWSGTEDAAQSEIIPLRDGALQKQNVPRNRQVRWKAVQSCWEQISRVTGVRCMRFALHHVTNVSQTHVATTAAMTHDMFGHQQQMLENITVDEV